jgi:hypothetical protein
MGSDPFLSEIGTFGALVAAAADLDGNLIGSDPFLSEIGTNLRSGGGRSLGRQLERADRRSREPAVDAISS